MPTDNPNPIEDNQPSIFAGTVATKKDQEIDRLESRLQELEDSRKEERLGWIVALLAVVNYILLKDVSNLFTPLIVVVFELLALLILARKLGVEYVEIIISRLIGSVTKRLGK